MLRKLSIIPMGTHSKGVLLAKMHFEVGVLLGGLLGGGAYSKIYGTLYIIQDQ